MINNEIKVTVICTTYNHSKYIKQALESFVTQKTTFKFEVIVHDDASTDDTADSIRIYEEKYPDIIKPIYQTTNQLSQKKQITFGETIGNMTKGEYVAFCEGDDYWCDENKLQKQFDALEKNQDCILCSHYTRWLENKTGEFTGYYPNKKYNLKEEIIEKKIQIDISINDLFHLSSWFIRKKIYDDYRFNRHDVYRLFPTGDSAFILYINFTGNIYILNDTMSIYRRGTEGSWSERVAKNYDANLLHMQKHCLALKKFDEYSKYTYHDKIVEIIGKMQYNIAVTYKDFSYFFENGSYKNMKNLKFELKVKLKMAHEFPNVSKYYLIIKKKIGI